MHSVVQKKDADKNIINKVYEEYYSWLIKRAYKKVQDISVCEDIFNDCVIGWINNTDTLNRLSENELRAYIAKSIDNACIAYLKKKSKVVFLSDETKTMDAFEDFSQNIDLITEKKYTYEVMKNAFQKLPEKDRDIIFMKYKLGLKDREMADIVGVKENSVRMTVRRSVKKLANIMEEEMK